MRYHFNLTEEQTEVIDSNTGNIVCFCYSSENAKLIIDALNGVNFVSSNVHVSRREKHCAFPNCEIEVADEDTYCMFHRNKRR